MDFQIITLFPERYESYLETGLPARAIKKGLFSIEFSRLRDYAEPERRGRVDDEPYGGGPGMVLQVGPIERALEDLPQKLPVVLFTPRGELLDQNLVRKFSSQAGFTLLPGYYEGVDERVAENLVDYQVSIGNYVLNSGDIPAMVLIEALTRLIPGYVGSEESLNEESNENGVLEYPHYTRPAHYKEWAVPEVLLSGNHKAIAEWRKRKSQEITSIRTKKDERPN